MTLRQAPGCESEVDTVLKPLGIPFSAHTRKVIINLIEKDLEFELTPVVPIVDEGPTAPPPDWAQLSPLRLIPVLRDGDLSLADSSVINMYLDRKHSFRS